MNFLWCWRFIAQQILISSCFFLSPLFVLVSGALKVGCWALLWVHGSFVIETVTISAVISAIAAFAHEHNRSMDREQKKLLLVVSRRLTLSALTLGLMQPIVFEEHRLVLCGLAALQLGLLFFSWFVAEMAITGTWL